MIRLRPFASRPSPRQGAPLLAATLVIVAAGCVLAAPAGAAPVRVAETQALVVLRSDHAVRSRASSTAPLVETVSARRPLTGVATVLPVIARRRATGGAGWVHVRLPGRPLGHTGWIRASQTQRDSTAWHVVVALAARQVVVYRDGLVQRRFTAAIGAPATPTPRGRFFVEEAVAISRGETGGPFALATSARSQVLQQFMGGPGQIALHGTGNLSGGLGTAISHGCIRISPRAISWLASRIGSGVPLTITR